jgi:spore cortex biosynthesis protein YabQ
METFFKVSEQTWLFLWACVIGIGLGIVYDFFRVFRIIIKHNKTAVFFEDVFFTFIFAMTLFIYSTEKARGELRFFIFLGAFLGFILYVFTVGYVVVTIIRKVVTTIYKVVKFIYNKVSPPIKKILGIVVQKSKKLFVKNTLTFKKIALKKQKSLKRRRSMVYNNHNNKQISNSRDVKNNGNKKRAKHKAKKASNF